MFLKCLKKFLETFFVNGVNVNLFPLDYMYVSFIKYLTYIIVKRSIF